MSGIWWVVGLIVGMRAGRRISQWGEDPPQSRSDENDDDRDGLGDPGGYLDMDGVRVSPKRLMTLLDGGGIPTPEERRFIRNWLDEHEDEV